MHCNIVHICFHIYIYVYIFLMIIITLLFYIVFLESHYYHVFLSLPLVIIFIFLTISFTVSIIVGIYQCCYDRYSICPYFDSDTRTHANTQTVSPLALFWLSLFLHLSVLSLQIFFCSRALLWSWCMNLLVLMIPKAVAV